MIIISSSLSVAGKNYSMMHGCMLFKVFPFLFAFTQHHCPPPPTFFTRGGIMPEGTGSYISFAWDGRGLGKVVNQ
jgi:hypothetical protein